MNKIHSRKSELSKITLLNNLKEGGMMKDPSP